MTLLAVIVPAALPHKMLLRFAMPSDTTVTSHRLYLRLIRNRFHG